MQRYALVGDPLLTLKIQFGTMCGVLCFLTRSSTDAKHQPPVTQYTHFVHIQKVA